MNKTSQRGDAKARSRGKTALERIDEFLAKEQGSSNAEMIKRMREAYFADVDALQKSGGVKLPE